MVAEASPLWQLYRREAGRDELIRECETLNDAARCIADIEDLRGDSLTLEVKVAFAIPENGPVHPDYAFKGRDGLYLVRGPAG